MSKVLIAGKAVPFLESYMRGEAAADEIDDYIDRWHDSADAEVAGLTLHEYLGLTKAEYDRWVQAPDSLPDIVRARRAS
jgi:hypothetical protein